MTLIMDGLIIAAAVFAGTYCLVLARRLRALRDLDSGLGAAITGMTRALEDARRVLEEAKAASRQGHQELHTLLARAETASAQLRILLAATRDLPVRAEKSEAGPARPVAASGPAAPSMAAPQRGAPSTPAPQRGASSTPAPQRGAPSMSASERGGRSTTGTTAGKPADPSHAHECAAPVAPPGRVEPPIRRPVPPGALASTAQAEARRQEDAILAALADFANARRS